MKIIIVLFEVTENMCELNFLSTSHQRTILAYLVTIDFIVKNILKPSEIIVTRDLTLYLSILLIEASHDKLLPTIKLEHT